jgi:hypothetical protein
VAAKTLSASLGLIKPNRLQLKKGLENGAGNPVQSLVGDAVRRRRPVSPGILFSFCDERDS